MIKPTWRPQLASKACGRPAPEVSACPDRLTVAGLELRDLPAGTVLVTGADVATRQLVRADDQNGGVQPSFLTFGPSLTRGVRATIGDPAAGGKTDVVTAAGAGRIGTIVTTVTGPPAGTYGTGQVLTYTITYSGVVTVTGTPRIEVDIAMHAGGPLGPDFLQRVYAAYTGGGGTNILTFRYTVQPGDGGPPNPYAPFQGSVGVTGPIDLNGGSIVDLAGDPASVTFTPPDSTGVRVNG